MKGGALIAKTSLNAENYVDSASCRTMLTMFSTHVSHSHNQATLSSNLCPAVTNLLQEIDARMESRTTQIQEGEDDEDITTLDMLEPASL